MRRVMMFGFAILAMALILGLPPAAQALTLASVDETWLNPVGATVTYSTVPISYGNEDEAQARWGGDTGSGQSGLGFTGVSPPSTTFETETPFELGQLRHFNNPVFAPVVTSIDLNVATVFSDPAVSPSFTFTFAVNETPNDTGDPVLDQDYIYFPSSFPDETFTIGDTIYTLKLLGFGPDAENLVSQFASPEGTTNSAK